MRLCGHAVQRAAQHIQEQGATMSPPVREGTQNLHCVATDGRVSIAAGWKQGIFNDVSQEAHLFIRTFRGALSIPGERTMYVFQPALLVERKLLVELTVSLELAWREDGKKEILSTDDLPHAIAIAYFDLISKANRGEIEMPFL